MLYVIRIGYRIAHGAASRLASYLAGLRGTTTDTVVPRRIAAIILVLGAFLTILGLAWDVQWHSDVGPDTFFTLLHLVFYSGTAIAGLACLSAALWYGWSQRRVGRTPVGRIMVDAWHVPIGFVIGGLGAATFLAFSFYDLWWHTVYGFDVTFESPPHIGLLLGILGLMIGATVVFAGRVRRARTPSARVVAVTGLCAAVAIALGGSIPFQEVTSSFLPGFMGLKLSAALVYPLALLMVASIVRQPGAATLLGVVFVLLRTANWYFTLWATPLYAASLGLFMRDNVSGIPDIADQMPLAVLLAGIIIDLVLTIARRRGLGVKITVLLAGAPAGLLLAWLYRL